MERGPPVVLVSDDLSMRRGTFTGLRKESLQPPKQCRARGQMEKPWERRDDRLMSGCWPRLGGPRNTGLLSTGMLGIASCDECTDEKRLEDVTGRT